MTGASPDPAGRRSARRPDRRTGSTGCRDESERLPRCGSRSPMCLNTSRLPAGGQPRRQHHRPGASRRQALTGLTQPLAVATHIVQLSAVTSQIRSPGRALWWSAAPSTPRTSVRCRIAAAGSSPRCGWVASAHPSLGGQIVTWTRTALSSAGSKTAAASRLSAAGRRRTGVAARRACLETRGRAARSARSRRHSAV